MRHLGRERLCRQLAQHGLYVNQGVAAAVDEDDGGLDVAGWVFRDLGISAAGAAGCEEPQRRVDVVVVHLKGLVADDLEPVDDGFGAGVGVEVGVGGEFLGGADVLGAPVEEEGQAEVDELGEEGRIEQGLPHGGRAEDGAAAEEEEEDLGGGFDERVDHAVGEARGGHGGREGDEDVDLVVELGVNGQAGEGLGGALGEADVGEGLLGGGLEDVTDAVGDVMECELVDGEVPEFEGSGG